MNYKFCITCKNKEELARLKNETSLDFSSLIVKLELLMYPATVVIQDNTLLKFGIVYPELTFKEAIERFLK